MTLWCRKAREVAHAAANKLNGALRPKGNMLLAEPITAHLGLFAERGAPVAFHRSIVCGNELGRYHALNLVFRTNTDERRHCGFALTIARLLIRMLDPERLDGLIGENIVPVI